MLVIRLAPVGRKNQPAYRIVLAEHSKPVNGKFQESLGFYNVSEGKKLEFDAARIEHWVNMGARPSDSVAALLKNAGVPNMEKFMEPRTLKRKKKNPEEVAEETEAPAPEGGEAEGETEAPAAEESAPAEEAAPAETPEAPTEDTPKEEVPAEETPAEEAAPVEEEPKEEAPKEDEAPSEEPAAEEAPVEEAPAEEGKTE